MRNPFEIRTPLEPADTYQVGNRDGNVYITGPKTWTHWHTPEEARKLAARINEEADKAEGKR